jgi:hypothetical protein
VEKDKISSCERKQPFLRQTHKKKKMTITKYNKQGGDNYHKVQNKREERNNHQ